MSVIDTLITDRTAADAARVRELSQKINDGTATEAEKQTFLSALKGAYNSTDLNRVGEAVAYLRDRLYNEAGTTVHVAPKTDFSQSGDLPTPAQAARYVQDVQTMRGAFVLPDDAPSAPGDLDKLTWSEANDIERILELLDASVTALKVTQIMSGEFAAGEV